MIYSSKGNVYFAKHQNINGSATIFKKNSKSMNDSKSNTKKTSE